MALPELPDVLKQAGRIYYDSLLKLKLNPEGLLWVYDAGEEEFRLWLIWSGLDKYGPLAISKLLFKAYNASALPKEVDPFSVYVANPDHLIGNFSSAMLSKYKDSIEKGTIDTHITRITLNAEGQEPIHSHYSKFGWVYHFQAKRNSAKKVNQDWRLFNESVSALAA